MAFNEVEETGSPSWKGQGQRRRLLWKRWGRDNCTGGDIYFQVNTNNEKRLAAGEGGFSAGSIWIVRQSLEMFYYGEREGERVLELREAVYDRYMYKVESRIARIESPLLAAHLIIPVEIHVNR